MLEMETEIVVYDDQRLRQISAPVTKFDEALEKTVADMFVMMEEGDGIGLAGPQVGLQKRIFVVNTRESDQLAVINPEIIETSPEVCSYEEGCLSLPGIYADVLRPERIKIQAKTVKGKTVQIEADGILARVLQHENDHLNGVLFIDHLAEKKREKLLKAYFKRMKKR